MAREIERLLAKDAADEESDLDEIHVDRLCHLLRSQGGEHGRDLADALLSDPDAPEEEEGDDEEGESDDAPKPRRKRAKKK